MIVLRAIPVDPTTTRAIARDQVKTVVEDMGGNWNDRRRDQAGKAVWPAMLYWMRRAGDWRTVKNLGRAEVVMEIDCERYRHVVVEPAISVDKGIVIDIAIAQVSGYTTDDALYRALRRSLFTLENSEPPEVDYLPPPEIRVIWGQGVRRWAKPATLLPWIVLRRPQVPRRIFMGESA